MSLDIWQILGSRKDRNGPSAFDISNEKDEGEYTVARCPGKFISPAAKARIFLREDQRGTGSALAQYRESSGFMKGRSRCSNLARRDAQRRR